MTMKRFREEITSGSQTALAFQAINFVESSLEQIVSSATKEEKQGHLSSIAAREKLVRASTLVEVLATFPAIGGELTLSPAALEELLSSARKIIQLLLLLPQLQLQYCPYQVGNKGNAFDEDGDMTPRASGLGQRQERGRGQLPRTISIPPHLTNSRMEVEVEAEVEEVDVDMVEDEEAVGSNVRFSNIVGNGAAKQALHENIVLPLTLPAGLRQQLLTGIRSGCGNVLLYGPVGVVWRALFDTVAFEGCCSLCC